MKQNIEFAIQDRYPDNFAWCYGCGHLNKEGHKFRTGWEDEKTVTFYEPKDIQTAIPGFVYGGLIASLIDCHGTGSASLALHRKNGYEPRDLEEPPRFVTASLAVKYLKPTPIGLVLKAVGTVEEIHPKKFKVDVEVIGNEEVYATGEVIAVLMPASFGEK